ncbi:hypothetical protein BABINDRAFT_160852 [Babjeviella inositovora NRRL Y-12698]|uniref:HSF-type DNA-binding domain-containing protein n=1 Tax=Babjeviella inositovora NRRL Y-12698 TaxID=984486 RepID=A0A1E3QUB6_9ASCO|nr:uncharacterized protein BABINDRAFT_160852 [Babjeviella inositovora NRRL Y-12698]ODQ80592.1 hypothetical protein BABINDRAFT_160852 [Babjeviella inositovora NRRL Y-12698]
MSSYALKDKNPSKKSAFVEKLFLMLSEPSLASVIWWTRGDTEGTFALLPGGEFSNCLTNYFKHGNISSFVRQLHMYGFHKVSDSQTPSNDNYDPSSNAPRPDQPVWEFKHSSGRFKKGDEESLKYIKRRTSTNNNAYDLDKDSKYARLGFAYTREHPQEYVPQYYVYPQGYYPGAPPLQQAQAPGYFVSTLEFPVHHPEHHVYSAYDNERPHPQFRSLSAPSQSYFQYSQYPPQYPQPYSSAYLQPYSQLQPHPAHHPAPHQPYPAPQASHQNPQKSHLPHYSQPPAPYNRTPSPSAGNPAEVLFFGNSRRRYPSVLLDPLAPSPVEYAPKNVLQKSTSALSLIQKSFSQLQPPTERPDAAEIPVGQPALVRQPTSLPTAIEKRLAVPSDLRTSLPHIEELRSQFRPSIIALHAAPPSLSGSSVSTTANSSIFSKSSISSIASLNAHPPSYDNKSSISTLLNSSGNGSENSVATLSGELCDSPEPVGRKRSLSDGEEGRPAKLLNPKLASGDEEAEKMSVTSLMSAPVVIQLKDV